MERPTQNGSVSVPEYGHWVQRRSHGARVVAYLLPPINRFLPRLLPEGSRVLDIGCGEGRWAAEFLKRGCRYVGVDPSQEGVSLGRQSHPAARFERLEATPDILDRLGEDPFDLVISTEVVEHVYLPRLWSAACFNALKPGGRAIVSTPYHGYLKNLVLSLTNRWDRHASPLWDGGHIKLWSRATLTKLLVEAGFVNPRFVGAGRWPYLWKSMVMSADRPA